MLSDERDPDIDSVNGETHSAMFGEFELVSDELCLSDEADGGYTTNFVFGGIKFVVDDWLGLITVPRGTPFVSIGLSRWVLRSGGAGAPPVDAAGGSWLVGGLLFMTIDAPGGCWKYMSGVMAIWAGCWGRFPLASTTVAEVGVCPCRFGL